MNVRTQVRQASAPRRVKLNVDQFRQLKRAGAFSCYGRSELLDGELSGVPLHHDDEPESDVSVPIRLRVRDYLMLHEAGLFADNGKTELIDGILYEMSPQHRPHWYAKNELTYRLRRALEELGSALYVGSEGSVLLSEFDLPEPDIVVTSEPAGAGPIPLGSVQLLVEIGDTTVQYDLTDKAQLYAAAGIAEYWVADLSAGLLHQMWGPRGDAYSERRTLAFGAPVASVALDGLVIQTDRL